MLKISDERLAEIIGSATAYNSELSEDNDYTSGEVESVSRELAEYRKREVESTANRIHIEYLTPGAQAQEVPVVLPCRSCGKDPR